MVRVVVDFVIFALTVVRSNPAIDFGLFHVRILSGYLR